MIPQDTIISTATDTIARASSAVTHTAEQIARVVSDTLRVSATTIRQTVDTLSDVQGGVVQEADSLLSDSLVQAHTWPVTLWGDTIIQPASLYRELHPFGDPLPYTIFHDNWVSGFLLLSFAILVLTVAWSRKFLVTQARNFFMPSNNVKDQKKIKTTFEVLTPFIMASVFCVNNGLLVFASMSHFYDFDAGLCPPALVIGFCVGTFALYYALRWILYKHINWIFFEKSKKRTWTNGFSFLISLESLLSYPIILFTLNQEWNSDMTFKTLILAYVLIRICLLYHTHRIFFPKLYGLFHLFAYLCTLEIIPILLLWKIFMLFIAELVIK